MWVSHVGDADLGATAQGQFCLVTLKVKNIGTEPQSFSDDDQKAFGSNGAELTADSFLSDGATVNLR